MFALLIYIPIIICSNNKQLLVGGFNPSEKIVSWGDYPIYEMENKKCLTQPTSNYNWKYHKPYNVGPHS